MVCVSGKLPNAPLQVVHNCVDIPANASTTAMPGVVTRPNTVKPPFWLSRLAALLATEEVSCFVAGDQGGTYNGNPLIAAVGIAVFKELNAPEFLDTVKAKADYIVTRDKDLLVLERITNGVFSQR